MSDRVSGKPKGLALGKLKTKVSKAPSDLLGAPKPQDEALDTEPSSVTTGISGMQGMFGRKAKAKEKSVAPIVETASFRPEAAEAEVAEAAEAEVAEAASPAAEAAEAAVAAAEAAEAVAEAPPKGTAKETARETTKEKYTDALKKLESLIFDEEHDDPYVKDEPDSYVPQSRRGFSKFIKMNFSEFMLEPLDKAKPVEAGDKYPYQKFVREYMRNASPYRGILVYHGLGSGKTCTAIATAEALFSTSNKKIIVMTPKTLRKNFLKEITFCGFRHFRLQNHWIPLDKTKRVHQLFASQVLNIPERHLKKANHIWVPDFEQPPNYNELSAEDQHEIREQILSILVYDEKKNPEGRIRFINYNGVLATKLKRIACNDPTFFDDAVIIVDEIHNLIRLMQGTIDPYLTELPGKKRKIPLEVVGADKWNPPFCLNEKKNYNRGYLFYRLLLSARNSKIVGLSGTPLINFPEELGILSNVLHGYLPVVEGVVAVQGPGVETQIESLLTKFPFTDFVEVKRDPTGGGMRFIATLLPEGVKKVEEGVERMSGPVPKLDEIVSMLKEEFKSLGMKFSLPIQVSAQALLPPFPQQFRDNFINEKNEIKNDIVLVKRLSGLISYYKGSRLDLMPKIVSDEVVRVPMSEYQQTIYSIFRTEEIEKKKTSSKEQTFDAIWTEAYNIETSKAGSAYRTATRQMGNFVFPSAIKRPRATESEIEKVDDEIDDSAPDDAADSPVLNEAFPEIEEDEEENVAQAKEEDAMIEKEEKEEIFEGEEVVKEAEEKVEEIEEKVEEEKPKKKKTLQEILAEKKEAKSTKLLSDCKTGRKPGETYKDACVRAKECLISIPGVIELLKMDNPQGLAIHSPKYLAILRNIAAASGSSLVYSQFVEMEGIGIFRIVMDINGYAPIEIESTGGGGYKFSARTEESFRTKPEQYRYISFTGSESEDVRALALNVFNAKFNELPESMTSVLLESGFEDNNNQTGQICRVFCITSAGAEGISLKNVRAVHIMDPHWNDVRLKQVKGRAIRLGSHLDLPESERNVQIFTYLSVFGKEAQLARSGSMMINAAIRTNDSLERRDAVEAGVPIPEGSATYTLTSDERLYVISERKKKIIDSLERIMKSSSVDCELNYEQNKDGSFTCLTLEGKVGDFLYHPDLQTDIRESASKYAKKKETTKVVKYFTAEGTRYAMEEKDGKYLVYHPENLEVKIGELTVKDGKPKLPIIFI